MPPVKVTAIRTYYPHWGKYSGIHQFLRYLDQDRYSVTEDVVPMGDEWWPPLPSSISRSVRSRVRRSGSEAYNLNDLVEEMSTYARALLGTVDIVHYIDGEHSLQYLPRLVRMTQHLRRPPRIIGTFHQPPEELHRFTAPHILAGVDHVVTMSPTQVPFFTEILPSNRVSVVRHGIDTTFFHPASSKPHDGVFRCITVGTWMRDYETVLETARRMTDVPVEFHILSSGFDPPHECPSSIVLHEGVSDAKLRSLYQQSDALFLPLHAATANNALLEGMACGLPVVSSALESVRAYTGDAALLADQNRPGWFADQLHRLRTDAALRRQYGEAARRTAEDLDWSHVARRFESIYESLST